MPKLASNQDRKAAPAKQTSFKVVETAEAMAKLVAETGMAELRLDFKEHSLRIRRKANSVPVAAAESLVPAWKEATVEEITEEFGHPVISQHVGIFQTHALKGSEALVDMGGQVTEQQVLGYIESMGIRHELLSPAAGNVAEILAEAGEPVEFGQVLMLIQ
jgi:acetyl-CoA carboxylase biotin carboxyl carrier protein